MTERQVEGLSRLDGERHADKAGPGGRGAVRLRIQRNEPGLADPAYEVPKGRLIQNGPVILLAFRRPLNQARQERGEFQFLKKGGQLGGVWGGKDEIVEVQGDIQVPLERHQLPADLELLPVLLDLSRRRGF
jgi:hypothetical protein